MATQADTLSARAGQWSRRRFFVAAAVILLFALAAGIYGLVALVHHIPRTVVMATGSEGGGYSGLGAQYRKIAAPQGVELTVVQTPIRRYTPDHVLSSREEQPPGSSG
jgi:hypothetical protein